MSENTPNVPSGAMPPKPAEAAKIQPKKETVRINLPPKPTSSPTIKLPTLPAGGPPPPTVGAPAPIGVPAPAAAPRPMAPPVATAAPAARVSAPAAVPAATTAQRPAAPSAAAPAPRAVVAPVIVGVSGLDKGLAIAAAVISLASLGSVLYLAFILKDTAAN